jgi:hypothetical protein
MNSKQFPLTLKKYKWKVPTLLLLSRARPYRPPGNLATVNCGAQGGCNWQHGWKKNSSKCQILTHGWLFKMKNLLVQNKMCVCVFFIITHELILRYQRDLMHPIEMRVYNLLSGQPWSQWTSTHQHTIHWMPLITQFRMKLNWINI